MRLLVFAALSTACSSANWEIYTADRAALECRLQEVCAESTAGLDCDAYIAQFEARPNPCVRFDAFYADACIDQLEDLLAESRSDPTTCPADPLDGAPACRQAFVESGGGPCRTPD